MSKTQPNVAQKVVNSVWRALRRLDGGRPPLPKVKLDGRRGYGDGDVPLPDRSSEAD